MNFLKRLARKILKEELDGYAIKCLKFKKECEVEKKKSKELESDNRRLRIKCEQMRGEILDLTEQKKKSHFKHKPKKGARK